MKQFARHNSRWEGNVTFDFKETGWKYVEMIRLALIRDYWQPLVNAGANFLLLKILRISSIVYNLFVKQEGPCSVELVT
jgi:hypothetical protein